VCERFSNPPNGCTDGLSPIIMVELYAADDTTSPDCDGAQQGLPLQQSLHWHLAPAILA
jgi:hypothetical protein